MAPLKNRFSRPKTYVIDGWEFPQYLSLLVYEREWLLTQQQFRNDSARGLVAIAQKIAVERGIPITEVLDTMSAQSDNAMLLPYLSEIQNISRDTSGDDLKDGVRMLLRSRLSAKWLKSAKAELAECYQIDISDEEAEAFELSGIDRLFSDDDLMERAAVVEVVTERIIKLLPAATFFRMAEYLDMENSGVATPEELPKDEAIEPAAPKNLDPD